MAYEAPVAGNWNDAVIYQEQFFGQFTEVLQQFSDVFNGGSNGTMIIRPRQLAGDFEQESFIKHIPDLIRVRDPKSNANVADKKIEQDELIRVKVNSGIGPVSQTLDFWRKIGRDPMEMSFYLGQQTGKQAAVDYVNTGILTLTTALEAQGSLTVDITDSAEDDKRLRTEYLIRANALFGDKSNAIRAYVMHSKPWHDILESQVVDGVTNIANVRIVTGELSEVLGRPVIVTDSDELVVRDEYDEIVGYKTLGLVSNALEVAQSEAQYVTMSEVTGQENIVWRMQGEFATTYGVQGFAYTGDEQPDMADLGNVANWAWRFHDKKMAAGVVLVTE